MNATILAKNCGVMLEGNKALQNVLSVYHQEFPGGYSIGYGYVSVSSPLGTFTGGNAGFVEKVGVDDEGAVIMTVRGSYIAPDKKATGARAVIKAVEGGTDDGQFGIEVRALKDNALLMSVPLQPLAYGKVTTDP